MESVSLPSVGERGLSPISNVISLGQADLLLKIRERRFTVGVVGLGRVGLPLAVAFSSRGIPVIGIDVDPNRIAAVNGYDFPFEEEGGAEAMMEAALRDTLRATHDTGQLVDADVVFITVATNLGQEERPDYGQVRAAISTLARHLRRGQLIILRSTVGPTAIAEVEAALAEHTTLRLGEDIFVVVAPERILAGHALREIERLPEIVGSADEQSADLAIAVMRTLNPEKEVHVTGAVEASLAKLFNNTYRYVQFALANEFALIAEQHGVDVREVLRVANGSYPRNGIPMPGPAGGPCLTKDGYLLVADWEHPDFIRSASRLNEFIPIHIVDRVERMLASRGHPMRGVNVGVLGMGFKADNDDLRSSPSLVIIEELSRRGAIVAAADPYHRPLSLEQILRENQMVILATSHREYITNDVLRIAAHVHPNVMLFDCWGMWDPALALELGVHLEALGRGDAS